MSSGRPFEAEPGTTYVARAKTAFVSAVDAFLPLEAREELYAIDETDRTERIRAWARRWRIDCTCVREWAEGQLTIRAIVDPAARTRSIYPVEIPDAWWDLLEELNDTKLTADGDDPRDLGKARAGTRPLAPIAANPLSEPRRAFLRRAAWHWDARAELAAEQGYTAVSSTPAIEKHAEWLARYRILQDSPGALAAEAGFPTEHGARSVARKISELRRAVGLEKLPPGRPKSRHS